MQQWSAELLLVGIVISYFTLTTAGIGISRYYRKRKLKENDKLSYARPTDSLRRRLQLWLYVSTKLGTYLDLLQGVLSAVSCALYVWETYQTEDNIAKQNVVSVMELVLSVLFLMDYWLRFFLAKNRLQYVWSLMGIVDVITVLPVFVYISIPGPWVADTEAPTYLRLVRLIKFLRVLRSLRIVRASLGFGLRRRLFTLIFSVVSLIFVAAGGFHFLEERRNSGLQFHTALYYTTIETLGRPRIESTTDEGYLWLMALVTLSVVLIPKQLAELFSVARAETVWQRRRYEPHSMKHIVLTGHQDFGSVNIVLYEFYHKDRGYHSSDVVLFFDVPPTREVEMLLEHPAYVSHVQYVQGSCLVEDDLQRVDLAHATAVVVLANKNPHNVFWEDVNITSTILSCKAAWQRHANAAADARKAPPPRLRVLAQVIKPETRQQLQRTPGWQHDDTILVIEEFSSLMVGLNALHRGFTTLIFNLFSHVEEQVSAPDWYREYEQGACQEIYRVVVSDSLSGANMEDAAAYLLRECRIVLLAMEISAASNSKAGVELVLYPGRRSVILMPGDVIYCIAYNVFLVNNSSCTMKAPKVYTEDCLLEAADCERSSRSPAHRNGKHRPTVLEWARQPELGSGCSTEGSGSQRAYESEGVEGSNTLEPWRLRAKRLESTRVKFDIDNENVIFEREGQGDTPPAGAASQVEHQASGNSGSNAAHIASDAAPNKASQVPTSRRKPALMPHTALDAADGRKKVLNWLLNEAFAGDRHQMHEEVSRFLLTAHLVKPDEDDKFEGDESTALAQETRPSLIQHLSTEDANDDSHILLSDMRASRMIETDCSVFWRVPSHLANHIVCFGATSSSGIRDLARLVLVKSDRSLVILSPAAKRLVDEASQDGWLKALLDSNSTRGRRLYFVKGSPSSPSMLDRVRLVHATAAIFLPCVPPEGVSAEATEREHRMIDSATVALTNFAAGEAESGLWTVTQLLHGAAVKFFTDHSAWRGASADPRWLDIAPLNTHALFAAGQIVAGTMLDRLLIETHFNDKAIPLFGLFVFGDEGGSRLFEGPLPDGFAGLTYADLCIYLLGVQLLPVGLLRECHRSYSNIFRCTETHSRDAHDRKLTSSTCRSVASHDAGYDSGREERRESKGLSRRILDHAIGYDSGREERREPRGLSQNILDHARRKTMRLRKGIFMDLTNDIQRTSAPTLDTSSEAQLPYVVTNPRPDLILKEKDRIFVLGRPRGASSYDVPAESPKQEVNSSLVSSMMHIASLQEHQTEVL